MFTKNQSVKATNKYNETTVGKVLAVRGNIVTIITKVNGYSRAQDWHISKVKAI